MKFLKSKSGGIAMFVMMLVVAAASFTANISAQTNNGTKPFRSYYDGSVSWADSLGNIDSLSYPYYLNGKKFEDFSLINGQTTNYRAIYVSASTNDTAILVVETKPEGPTTMPVYDCDSVRLPGKTSVTFANMTSSTFSFSSTTAQLWRFRVEHGTAGDGTANRNNGYILLEVWSNTLNTVPQRFKLGNY